MKTSELDEIMLKLAIVAFFTLLFCGIVFVAKNSELFNLLLDTL